MTFDIGLHEVCVRVGVRYVITKFSQMDSLPNFLTYGAPLRARESSAMTFNLLLQWHLFLSVGEVVRNRNSIVSHREILQVEYGGHLLSWNS